MLYRTYTMRLKTTSNQRKTLSALLDQLCELYNMALQQRRDVWKSHGKTVRYYEQQKQLTDLRHGVPEYAYFPAAIQRDPLRRLQLAFDGFFRRIKSGETPGYPRFRPRSRYTSFVVDKQNFAYENGTVRITKLGTFRIKTRFRIKGTPCKFTICQIGTRWVAHLVCEIGEAPVKRPVTKTVGIDLGITKLVTLSDGSEIANPRWKRQVEGRIAAAQRNLETKRKGSNNRAKAKERLRKIHRGVAGRRKSYVIAIAKELVKKYDLIAYESLTIDKMARLGLGKDIMDAAWGQLIERLKYEAEKAGVWAVPVNPRGTTQTCSGCGKKIPKKLSQRVHECSKCGLTLGRDHNAALNILTLGMSVALEAEYV